MNPIRRIPLHVLMLAGLLAAPEAPAADDKAAKPEAKAAPSAAPETKLQAYAGINVNAYGAYQRERDPVAAVPEGIGLVVGFLDPEGPAVGKLQEKDVLTRLDDQVLVNPEQFRALLQTRKPCDTVKIVRVRGEDVGTVEIKLTGKAVPVSRSAGSARARAVPSDPSGAPVISGTGGIRIMVNGQEIDPGQMVAGGALQLTPGGQGNVIVIDPHSAQLPAEARRMLDEMRKRGMPVPPDATAGSQADQDEVAGNGAPGVTVAPGASRQVIVRSFSFGTNGGSSTSSSMYTDDEGTVSIRKEGDKKLAVVKDASGKVLFDGEITTEEQLKAQAESIRNRIALADGGSIRIPGMPGQEPAKAGVAQPATKKKAKRDPHEGA